MANSHFLIIQQPGKIDERRFPLSEGVYTIGRDARNDVVLSEDIVSRHHAELRIEQGEALLKDVGSTHGTFLYGQRMTQNRTARLSPNDAFHIGPYLLTYLRGANLEEAVVVAPPILPPPGPPEPPTPIPGGGGGRTFIPTGPPSDDADEPRPAEDPIEPQSGSSSYLQFLPDIFHPENPMQDNFLGRFLYGFELIWEPREQRQDHIEIYFDPQTCPKSFIDWLGLWVGMPVHPEMVETRKRLLIRQATRLYPLRGTESYLREIIHIATGYRPVIAANAQRSFAIRVTMTLPANSGISDELLLWLIERHKPAFCACALEVVRQ